MLKIVMTGAFNLIIFDDGLVVAIDINSGRVVVIRFVINTAGAQGFNSTGDICAATAQRIICTFFFFIKRDVVFVFIMTIVIIVDRNIIGRVNNFNKRLAFRPNNIVVVRMLNRGVS